ncbi:MAG: Na+/H+ antiporter [Corynebacterium sp.]|nr:Na+/H+ antiporter [Corynebacterium sp.]
MVESLLVLGFGILIAAALTVRTHIPAPLTLILTGLVASMIPGLGDIVREAKFDPEVILSLFLPFLLYWEALNISLRGIRRMLRGVVMSGTVMVLGVAMAEGLIGSWLGLGVGAAFLVGAAVAPTDATAVAAFGKGISKQVLLSLRAESLINDGTALVIFAVASNYAAGDTHLSPLHIGGDFVISFLGATVVGIAVGYVVSRLGRFVNDPMIGNVCRIMVPFLAYFLAEQIHASGVLATVVAGLVLAQTGPRFISTGSRVTGRHFWIVSCYILNAVLFLAVGITLPEIIGDLSSDTIRHALIAVVVLYVVMMLARFLITELVTVVSRISSRIQKKPFLEVTFAERLLYSLAGFRGAISLAVALSVPEEIASRDVVVFVTAGIVILSLILQGIAVPWSIKYAQAHPSSHMEEVDANDREEVRRARIANYEMILEELHQTVQCHGGDEALEARLRTEFERSLELYRTHQNSEFENSFYNATERRIRLALINQSRQYMLQLRDSDKLDDEAFVELVDVLDAAELNINGPISAE